MNQSLEASTYILKITHRYFVRLHVRVYVRSNKGLTTVSLSKCQSKRCISKEMCWYNAQECIMSTENGSRDMVYISLWNWTMIGEKVAWKRFSGSIQILFGQCLENRFKCFPSQGLRVDSSVRSLVFLNTRSAEGLTALIIYSCFNS